MIGPVGAGWEQFLEAGGKISPWVAPLDELPGRLESGVSCLVPSQGKQTGGHIAVVHLPHRVHRGSAAASRIDTSV